MNAAIPANIRKEIERRLSKVAEDEGIRYLLAIESGSRAWGFPSPDSDYDVRFLFVRPREHYLALSPPRDVVERPIVDEVDLNGWDIRKALGLMLKHNAALSEWIESPIRYLDDDPVISALVELGDRFFDPRGFALHYASLGRAQVARWGEVERGVSVKKLFYALRPALAIRCLRLDSRSRPPMQLQELMQRCDLSHLIIEQIEAMIELKAKTREAGLAKAMPEIVHLIHAELERAGEVPARQPNESFSEEAERIFLALVNES
ncbi:nucleotidyltransferase domain-containing protein [Erythrobacter mangrovi]|uniref:Nucleotidyltransferase domain-containing protein n=1 Tax=Erythrobacter mangrovi TaxID=2739433 RepID=A0A7D3XYK3_9SPHN|nr:nucleotidyltransferase domain-containing protein [Erythrobacter mangrovi]QKG70592.1 nucleotidyltransferase domain-containing protein [Erythrobacter mangrovi]